MKRFGWSFALTLAALAGSAMKSNAQTNEIMRVRIDHSFAAAQSWLPAGDYEIRTLDIAGGQPMLLFTSNYGSVLVPANRYQEAPGVVASRPEAVLAIENDKYYLRRLKVAGEPFGYEIIGSPAVASVSQ